MKPTFTLTRALGVVGLAALTALPAAWAHDNTDSNSTTESSVVHPEATTSSADKSAAQRSHDEKLAEMQATTDGTYSSGETYSPQGSEAAAQQRIDQQAGTAGGSFSKIDPIKDRMLSVMQADTDGTPRGDSFSQPLNWTRNAPFGQYQLDDGTVPATMATNTNRTRNEYIAMQDRNREQINTSAAAPERIQSPGTSSNEPSVTERTTTHRTTHHEWKKSEKTSESGQSGEAYKQTASRDLPAHAILFETSLRSALVQAQGLQSQLKESQKSGEVRDLSSFKAGQRELQADLNAAETQHSFISSRIHQYPDLAQSGEFNKLNQSYKDLKPVESSWKSRSARPSFWKDQKMASNDLNKLTDQLRSTLNAAHSFSVAKLDIKSPRNTG